MESVTIIFSMFRLVTVEILSYGVRYTLIIAKMRVVKELRNELPHNQPLTENKRSKNDNIQKNYFKIDPTATELYFRFCNVVQNLEYNSVVFGSVLKLIL